MPRSYEELFPDDGRDPDLVYDDQPVLRDPEPEAAPEPVEDLYTGPRSAAEVDALARLWERDDIAVIVHDEPRWVRKRRRLDAERQALFAADQRRRRAAIEAGEADQPDEYKGQVFEYGTSHGMAYGATPPYRDDPQAPLTAAFIAFQAHHHLTRVRTNPQYYCAECRAVFAGVVCPFAGCRSARVRYPEPEDDGAGPRRYRCLTCSRGFDAERVCGQCLAKRPEVRERMRQEAAEKARRMESRKAKTRVQATRSGSRIRPLRDDVPYPD